MLFRSNNSNLSVIGYSGSDFTRSVVNRKSVSGYIFLIADAAAAYASRKQASVAISTTEAEYVALENATKHVI